MLRKSNRSLLVRSVGLLFLFLLTCRPVEASDWHPIGTLPTKPGAGFTVGIEYQGMNGSGYHPVRLKFLPARGTFIRNHSFQVILGPRSQFAHPSHYDVTLQCEVPQGSAVSEHQFLLPQFYRAEYLQAVVLEDGRRIDNNSSRFSINSLRVQDAENLASIGIITPQDEATQDQPWKVCPDVRTMLPVFGNGPLPEDVDVLRLTHANSIRFIDRVQPCNVQFRRIDEANMPKNWLGYSQLDVIMIPGPVLKRVEQSQPESMKAIDDWIASGGQLWVYAAKDISCDLFSKVTRNPIPTSAVFDRAQLEISLRLNEKNDTSELSYQYWMGVRKLSTQGGANTAMTDRAEIYKKLQKTNHVLTEIKPQAELASRILHSPYGLGKIVTIEEADPFPGSIQFWESLQTLAGGTRMSWSSRHGIDVSNGSDSYWTWLIGSVGSPPVKSFILLNAIFAITMGPFCYSYFRKHERLYLLYFIAPAIAVLSASLLFFYAVVADGLSTRVRVQQITYVDGKHGKSMRQTRQTYFAAIADREGLRFRPTTAVYPVISGDHGQRYQYSWTPGRNFISFPEGDQRFSGQFLPSRSQVQYYGFEPNIDSLDIEVDMSQSPPTIKNSRNETIERLLFKDDQTQLWMAENIAPGATQTLLIAKIDSPLQWFNIPSATGTIPSNSFRTSNWTFTGTNSTPGFLQSNLSSDLTLWLKSLPPKCVLCKVPIERSSLGAPQAEVIDSIHILMGSLP